MRSTAWIIVPVLVAGFVALGQAFPQGTSGGAVSPPMACTEALDLDVFIEAINESNLAGEIAGYLDDGAICKFLSIALHSTDTNGDRVYHGCAAFVDGSNWDALKWDYEYDASSSIGVPSIPYDVLTYRTEWNPTGTSGLDTILPDRLSWDYLVHVCNNCPEELRDELDTRTLKDVWVEHETGSSERVLSYWRYEGSGGSKTWRVWSTFTNGQFGALNVD